MSSLQAKLNAFARREQLTARVREIVRRAVAQFRGETEFQLLRDDLDFTDWRSYRDCQRDIFRAAYHRMMECVARFDDGTLASSMHEDSYYRLYEVLSDLAAVELNRLLHGPVAKKADCGADRFTGDLHKDARYGAYMNGRTGTELALTSVPAVTPGKVSPEHSRDIEIDARLMHMAITHWLRDDNNAQRVFDESKPTKSSFISLPTHDFSIPFSEILETASPVVRQRMEKYGKIQVSLSEPEFSLAGTTAGSVGENKKDTLTSDFLSFMTLGISDLLGIGKSADGLHYANRQIGVLDRERNFNKKPELRSYDLRGKPQYYWSDSITSEGDGAAKHLRKLFPDDFPEVEDGRDEKCRYSLLQPHHKRALLRYQWRNAFSTHVHEVTHLHQLAVRKQSINDYVKEKDDKGYLNIEAEVEAREHQFHYDMLHGILTNEYVREAIRKHRVKHGDSPLTLAQAAWKLSTDPDHDSVPIKAGLWLFDDVADGDKKKVSTQNAQRLLNVVNKVIAKYPTTLLDEMFPNDYSLRQERYNQKLSTLRTSVDTLTKTVTPTPVVTAPPTTPTMPPVSVSTMPPRRKNLRRLRRDLAQVRVAVAAAKAKLAKKRQARGNDPAGDIRKMRLTFKVAVTTEAMTSKLTADELAAKHRKTIEKVELQTSTVVKWIREHRRLHGYLGPTKKPKTIKKPKAPKKRKRTARKR